MKRIRAVWIVVTCVVVACAEPKANDSADETEGGNGGETASSSGGTAGASSKAGSAGQTNGEGGGAMLLTDASVAQTPDVGLSTPDTLTPDTAAMPSRRSSGCGKPHIGTSSWVRQAGFKINNLQREYFIFVPKTYDPTRSYPLIFRWYGAGGVGLGQGVSPEVGSKEDAIVVSATGHSVDFFGQGWEFATDGADVKIFDMLLKQTSDDYCIDPQKIFSYGFSMGGGFTLVLGCARGDVLRGVAAVAGGWLPPAPTPKTCKGHVATFIVQGSKDTVVTPAHAANLRDTVFLPQNGCKRTSQPVAPSPCVQYDGCLAGYPEVWCLTNTGHLPQDEFANPGAWNFFKTLPDVSVP